MGPPLPSLEALHTTNISCACIMEYFDSCTTVHRGCHSHLWTTNYPATNDNFLHTIFGNITQWFDIYCCISAAYLLHLCQQPRRRLWCNPKQLGKKIIHLVLIVAILGLIITLLALYELMLIVQHIETGVKGILLPLLPSFPLSALGWYLKKRSQKNAANGNAVEQMAEEQQSINMSDYSGDEEPLPL